MRIITLFLFATLLLSSSSVAAFAPAFLSPSQQRLASLNYSYRRSSTRVFQTIQQQEDEYLDRATKSEGVMAKPDIVYIIMYNPSTPEEGIHTMEHPRGSKEDLLLAFESLEDCVSFSKSLKEDPSVPHEPVPTPSSMAQIEEACLGMGLPLKVVPAGA